MDALSPLERDWSEALSPSLDDLAALGRAALAGIPEELRRLAGDVLIRVADFPEDDALADLGLESPFDLLGLFQGVGLAHAPAMPESGGMPNMVWLFRRPILDYWAENEETLGDLVAHVLIHEIGHHFGLSDDDIDAIEEE